MRIATFNIENLDEDKYRENGELIRPSLEDRAAVLRPQLLRLNADIICFQEVHGQETEEQPRSLKALKSILIGTPYEDYYMSHTKTSNNEAYDKRNLVIVSRYPIHSEQQHKNDLILDLLYRPTTGGSEEDEAKPVKWERPVFYAKIDVNGTELHIINLHLKSKIPTNINDQYKNYQYKSVNGWAEGFFVSSMKRVGQALETRMKVDEIFNEDPDAKIVVVGDLNAEPGDVPVETIVGSIENTGNPSLSYRQLYPCSNSIPKDRRYTHLHKGHGNLLDHMVVSRTMISKYVKSEVHNEFLHDESIAFATDKKYPESDHAPFVAEFDL